MPVFNTLDLFRVGAELLLIGWAFSLFVIDLLLPKDFRRTIPVLAGLGLFVTGITVFTFPMVSGKAWNLGYFSKRAAVYTHEAFGGMIVIDGFAQYFKLLFLAAALLTVLASMRFLTQYGRGHREFYPLLLISTAGLMLLVSAQELLTLWISLETAILPLYILVGYLKNDKRSNEAALKMFLMAAFSSAVFIYGVSLVYGMTGSLFLKDILASLQQGATYGGLLPFALIMMAAALAFEVTLVPFHAWAPDTYEGAPTPVTAFLSVAPKAAALAVLMRIFLTGFTMQSSWWQPMFAVLAALTIVVGNLAALRQDNVKRMLAYSSIAHAGYMMMGFVAVDRFGLSAVMFYLAAYVFMNLGAFYVLLALSRNGQAGERLEDFAGLSRRAPGLSLMMLVFMLSLTGIPFTAGFMGKFFLFGAAIASGFVWLAVLAAMMTVVSLYYYMRVVYMMYFIDPDEDVEIDVCPSLRMALGITFVMTLGIGLFPDWLYNFARNCAGLFGP